MPDDRPKPRVLHVVEALGGGVMVALRDYIINSQDSVDHVVLGIKRDGHDTGDFDVAPVLDLGPRASIPKMAYKVHNVMKEVSPDFIHLHSSWAGVIGRLLPIDRNRIIYTPHCYAFERRDIGFFSRLCFAMAEKALAMRVGHVFAVSPREATLARKLGRRGKVSYIPNAALFADARERTKEFPEIKVVAAGRVMAQKDPEWFATFSRTLLHILPNVNIYWLGGGEANGEETLRREGVHVTGWLSRSDLIDRMATADIYVHSAAWEGSPISILEAASMGIPLLARRIPALESLGLPYLHDSPYAAAEWLVDVLQASQLNLLAEESHRIARRHTPEVQGRALAAAYKQVQDSNPRRFHPSPHMIDIRETPIDAPSELLEDAKT